ncbi:hypothetical protein, partial [Halothiobacillus sp.]|uniref:hypothetical protein n=1 Tax=Halothiobacillus sp. TaxID=1891311 RepID=UPI002620943B
PQLREYRDYIERGHRSPVDGVLLGHKKLPRVDPHKAAFLRAQGLAALQHCDARHSKLSIRWASAHEAFDRFVPRLPAVP